MNFAQQLDHFHKTHIGFLVFGIVELGVAYLFASLAINSGAWWQYVLVLIFLFGGLQNLVKIFITHKK